MKSAALALNLRPEKMKDNNISLWGREADQHELA
jgi:hypothetical protein